MVTRKTTTSRAHRAGSGEFKREGTPTSRDHIAHTSGASIWAAMVPLHSVPSIRGFSDRCFHDLAVSSCCICGWVCRHWKKGVGELEARNAYTPSI